MINNNEKKYYLNKDYATSSAKCWVLETAKENDETDTHIWLHASWGISQWIEKEKLVVINKEIYEMINFHMQEFFKGIYYSEKKLNNKIKSYLKSQNIELL